MIYIKFHSGYETGRNLLASLKDSGVNVRRFKQDSLNKLKKDDIVVRWGDSSDGEVDSVIVNKGAKVLNQSLAIIRNTNKLKSLEVFGKSGLNVPKIYTDKTKIKTFPVLGRDRHHHGGLDIVIINGNNHGNNNYNLIPDKDFYTGFLDSKKEYRVHVFDGEIIRITRKVFRGHDKDGNETEKGLIKNDTFGWGHSNVDPENLLHSHGKAAIDVVKAIGLDFGAVDLLIDKNDVPYILEVNSSPRLNTIGLEVYTNRIINLSKSKQLFSTIKQKVKTIIKW